MRLFPKSLGRIAVLALLFSAVFLLSGERGNATTIVPFTPDGVDPGAVDLNTTIVIPGEPAGGTLSFNLTLGANYSLGAFSGANGSFDMELDTQSTPFWSGAFLTASPSTAGTTDYGDQTLGILIPANITDTSLWTASILAGDFPVTLTITSSFSGFCDGPDACYPPAATFSYDFTPNTSATPLPGSLPLLTSGVGLIGWMCRRRKRKTQLATSLVDKADIPTAPAFVR